MFQGLSLTAYCLIVLSVFAPMYCRRTESHSDLHIDMVAWAHGKHTGTNRHNLICKSRMVDVGFIVDTKQKSSVEP